MITMCSAVYVAGTTTVILLELCNRLNYCSTTVILLACASNLMDSETDEEEDSSFELEVHKGGICKGHHARFL